VIDHGPSGRVDLVSTETSGPRFFVVRTETIEDGNNIAPSLLNSLGTELVASAVPAGRQFALD
jgi:hypothetical protein